MALIEHTLFGKIDRVDIAIKRLQNLEQEKGYHICFSGGKDSVVIKWLAEQAGVKHECHYNVTSVDPPELVRFVKSFDNVKMDIRHYSDGAPITMWNLIVRKRFPPTRRARFCCEKLKEGPSQRDMIKVTGVRWAESSNRKKYHGLITEFKGKKGQGLILNNDNDEARRMVESCYLSSTLLLNPIIDWSTEMIWELIRGEKIPYCELYDRGRSRLGCVGCPLSSNQEEELNRYPKFKEAYIRAFGKMLEARRENHLESKLGWNTGWDVYKWWIGKGPSIPKGDWEQIMMDLDNEYREGVNFYVRIGSNANGDTRK
jgi:phosphoadenosine phosphosulfate reductase